MTTKPKSHSCWCVFDPDGKPLWYTCRPHHPYFAQPQYYSTTIYEKAAGICWATAVRRGFSVRRMRMTEVK